GATAAIVIFAARAGLAANAEIVEVLHLIGAEDRFIAQEVQRHFLVLGLKGASIGLAVAVALMLVIAGVIGNSAETLEGFFLPQFGLGPAAALWLLTVPVGACLLTTLVARTTVLRELGRRL
ncbi:MAG: ABC transporter permease, partial [Pseudomonadota bacterium]